MTELETIVCDWVAKALNLPSSFMSAGTGGGVIQGTASEAVITCIVAARERYLERATAMLEGEAKQDRVDQLRGKLVVITSEQAHSCTAKGARIAGVRFKSIKTHLDDDLALRGDSLRATLEECQKQGLHPFYLTISLGATPTCAVDRFDEIAEVLKDYPDVWTHVDAAYAGAALILPEYQHLTKHFEAFDSFDLNLHSKPSIPTLRTASITLTCPVLSLRMASFEFRLLVSLHPAAQRSHRCSQHYTKLPPQRYERARPGDGLPRLAIALGPKVPFS